MSEADVQTSSSFLEKKHKSFVKFNTVIASLSSIQGLQRYKGGNNHEQFRLSLTFQLPGKSLTGVQKRKKNRLARYAARYTQNVHR